MAFDTFESGQQSSQPVELYTITLGATIYRWTSAEDDVVEGADTFTATNIRRERLTGGGRDAREKFLTIILPADNALVQQYINSVPGVKASVVIERSQRPDSFGETIILFEGRVASIAFENEGRVAKVKVEPRVSATSRPIPRFNYQGLCNHVLYDARCQVDDTDPTYKLSNASVASESGNTITVTGASGYTDGWFTGGFIEADSGLDHRLILDHVGDVLTLHLPFSTSQTGKQVNVFAGCSHEISVCKSKFDNVVNYGGFAFVPTKNIFETGLD